MAHHQWLLEEKEKWKASSPMKCRSPTLWHALKPSCDCATRQIRYLKKTKTTKTRQRLHLLQQYHLPQSISAQVELVLCLCPRRAAPACLAGEGAASSLGAPAEQTTYSSKVVLLYLHCWHDLSGLDSGWFCTMQFLSLLCLRRVNIGIFILGNQINVIGLLHI